MLARLALGLSPALLCGAPSCSECTYGAVSALQDIARHSSHRAPPSAAPAPRRRAGLLHSSPTALAWSCSQHGVHETQDECHSHEEPSSREEKAHVLPRKEGHTKTECKVIDNKNGRGTRAKRRMQDVQAHHRQSNPDRNKDPHHASNDPPGLARMGARGWREGGEERARREGEVKREGGRKEYLHATLPQRKASTCAES